MTVILKSRAPSYHTPLWTSSQFGIKKPPLPLRLGLKLPFLIKSTTRDISVVDIYCSCMSLLLIPLFSFGRRPGTNLSLCLLLSLFCHLRSLTTGLLVLLGFSFLFSSLLTGFLRLHCHLMLLRIKGCTEVKMRRNPRLLFMNCHEINLDFWTQLEFHCN